MSIKLKRLFSGVTTFLVIATMVVPANVGAMTIEELQEQIAALQQQLLQYQQQLEQITGTPTTPTPIAGIPSGFQFDRALSQGMTGNDVKYLQIVLNSNSATQVATTGAGSPGNETSFFGSLTKAGVIKFQELYASDVLAPWGLTRGTGFVGQTTRDKLNSLLAADPTPPTPVPGDYDNQADCEDAGYYWYDDACHAHPEGEEPIVDGALNVSLSAQHPASGHVLVNTGGTEAETMHLMGAYNFVAGNGDVKVNQITFTRDGVLADGDIENLYLLVDGEVVADFATNPSTRKFLFEGSPLFTVKKGQTAEVELRMDIAPTAVAGNTVAFRIVAAGDISTVAGTVAGNFPLNGNPMVVTAVNLGTFAATVQATGASDDRIGSTGVDLAEVTLTPGVNDVSVKELIFTIVGTLGTADLANFELVDQITENVLASASSMTSGKRVIFSGLDITLSSARDYYIRGDIKSGSGRTFKFTVEEDYHVTVYDTEFNVRLNPTITNSQGDQNIAAGDFEIIRAADSPLGTAPYKGTNVVLARYELTARGERTRVNSLGISLRSMDSAGTGINDRVFSNVKVLVNGSQKGTAASSLTTTAGGTANEIGHTFSFGNTFIVNVGDTAKVEIVADLSDTAWNANERVRVSAVTDSIPYRLLDSGTDKTGGDALNLPVGYTLALSQSDVTAELASETVLSSVLAMGKTYEVGRWTIEAENEGTRIRRVNFTGNTLTQNVVAATLRLYNSAGTQVASVSRDIRHASNIWFGNNTAVSTRTASTDAGTDYPATTPLNWLLEQDKIYSLALELTFDKHSDIAGEGATSGYLPALNLHHIRHRTVNTNETVNEDQLALASNTHELRRAVLTASGISAPVTTQSPSINSTVMRFNLAAESGARRVTLDGFKLTVVSETAITTATQPLTFRTGSASGTIIARLRNVNIASIGVATTHATNTVVFDSDPGLEVGDVFQVATGGNVVAVSVDGVTTTVRKIDGTDLDADEISATSTSNANVAFLNLTTLYVPVLSDSLGRITAGSSQEIFVVGDTTGMASTEKLTTRIQNPEDIRWFDESADDPFTTTRIKTFPLEWVLTY